MSGKWMVVEPDDDWSVHGPSHHHETMQVSVEDETDPVCLVVSTYQNHRTFDIEERANLIAAAPDLLEALVAAMAFIDSHVADPDITAEMARNYSRLLCASPHEAIAKARGES